MDKDKEIILLKERIGLLEFNNKGLGDSCEKHMQTINQLVSALKNLIRSARTYGTHNMGMAIDIANDAIPK